MVGSHQQINMTKVSIIIPAHNAAATIAETIESLLVQTCSHWEAIIIDDGSVDETVTVANRFAQTDSRIRVVSQPQGGVSAARNAGIKLAQFDWLLFLDADDWIAPTYIEKMTAAIASNPNLDAVHCGWRNVLPDGTHLAEKYGYTAIDIFPVAARQCPFIIHACVVNKAIVEVLGGFDCSLKTCEDTDLWQRIARTGARFGAVKEALAFYRMRPKSLSRNGTQLLMDGLRVQERGHCVDSRVPVPAPEHAQGQPREQFPVSKYCLISWLSGLWLGQGEDACHLLQAVTNEPAPNLDPEWIAQSIFESVPFSVCKAPIAWLELWDLIQGQIKNFLLQLETQAQAPKLTDRTCTVLERLILQQIQSQSAFPLSLGRTHAVQIEITAPIEDIYPPTGTERLYCAIFLEGTRLGNLELPICDGVVPKYVLVDAIVANFDLTWKILGRFFEQTIYSRLRQHQHENSEPHFVSQLHNQIGWETFLQELWGRSEWSSQQFYDPQLVDNTPLQKQADEGWIVIEVSEDLPNVKVTTAQLQVVLTVGGAALGVINIPVKQKLITAQALRVALTIEGGMELCRACVREGLLERSLNDSTSLRTRLAEAAQKRRTFSQTAPNSQNSTVEPGLEQLNAWQSEWLSACQNPLILGRRSGALGTSASRRASLPAAAIDELCSAANHTREMVIAPPQSEQIDRIIYVPELISGAIGAPASTQKGAIDAKSVQVSFYSRNYFETLFATQADPWKYTTPYEQIKYEQTLSLLPKIPIGRALELACAEGHFTIQLAPHVQTLLATDISQIAVERTQQRCAKLTNVTFRTLDLSRDELPGKYQLIVCSEVLYYIEGGKKALRAFAQRVANALEPGGYFLTANANLVVDEPDRPGYSWNHAFGAKGIGETFASIPSLSLVKELRSPLYRIQLFQKRRPLQILFRQPRPEVVELPQSATPSEEVAQTILWNGGKPEDSELPEVTTRNLPILMYHSVSAEGSAQLSRWRVSPQAFEEQLRYLRDAGYYSITLETWRQAIATKQPLPGRAVLITFDDGYLNFFTTAYPLLKQYGFSATVFLVADYVGQLNRWDTSYEEELPLMDWHQIRQLQAAGIEFGSHTATHQLLTSLSIPEIVQEGVRSRAILSRELGTSIEAIAYPFGDHDEVVGHLIGACGYLFGLTCRANSSRFEDSLLTLPRIEVCGSDRLNEFIKKLNY
jgi:peptidoglycan/xylan/chitin deacetylase (PgdA/CDA1 family)/2-polyprenyl-3-methyl-5-hydroxy-6-metoxy-1,4-benzoquinol methylase